MEKGKNTSVHEEVRSRLDITANRDLSFHAEYVSMKFLFTKSEMMEILANENIIVDGVNYTVVKRDRTRLAYDIIDYNGEPKEVFLLLELKK